MQLLSSILSLQEMTGSAIILLGISFLCAFLRARCPILTRRIHHPVHVVLINTSGVYARVDDVRNRGGKQRKERL